MRGIVGRVATAAGLAVVLVAVLAEASSGSAGQSLILGRSNNAGTKNTSLTSKSSGNSFVLYQNGTGSALSPISGFCDA